MPPPQSNDDLLPARRSDAVLGAVLIHAVIADLFFFKGAVFGAAETAIMSAVGSDGSVGYGLEGGFRAVRTMLLFYIFGLGVPVLVASVLGAFLGLMVFPALRHRQAAVHETRGPRDRRLAWHPLLGAILVHPASLVLASLWGAVAGAEPHPFPTSDPSRAAQGFAGAFNGVTAVLYVHIVSKGFTFFALSLAGALCGAALRPTLRLIPKLRQAVADELNRK